MHLFNRFHSVSKMVVAAIFFNLLVTISFAQESKYLGNEKNITHQELLQKASKLDFSQTLFLEVYSDSKNTYYALKTSEINSRYERIKLLERISLDQKIVNIGASPDTEFSLFLVNNHYGLTSEQITNTMNTMMQEVKTEAKNTNPTEQNQWLLENDKYSEKK